MNAVKDVKEKIHDFAVEKKAKAEAKAEEKHMMNKVKNDAKAEESAEKELAKARMEVAHEVRLAKEAEAAMESHVARAEEIADREASKNPTVKDKSGFSAAQNAIVLEAGNAPSSHMHTESHHQQS